MVVGSTRALVLDTGFGVGDLRSVVDELVAEKPFDVALTHGHVDHAGGASQFEDVNVYLCQRDWDLVRTHATRAHRISDVMHGPKPVPSFVTEDDFVPERTEGWLPLDEGYTFDLGGVTVGFIAVPGHTHGMLCPLVPEDRTVFFGDACGEHTMLLFPESTTIQQYHQALLHLREREDEWDTCLRNHGSYESPKALLSRNIDLCERILAGTDDAVPFGPFDGHMGLLAYDEKGRGPAEVPGNIVYPLTFVKRGETPFAKTPTERKETP